MTLEALFTPLDSPSQNQNKPRLGSSTAQKSAPVPKLIHGDSLSVMAEMEPESFDCVWTDPPYLLSNGGTTCVAGKRASVNKGKWDRSLGGIDEDLAFHKKWIAACTRLLKPGGTIWVSGTLHVYPHIALAMQYAGLRILNDIVWEKSNPPPNLGCRCFTHATEILLWAAKGKGHTFNYAKMKQENGGKQMKSVWRFPSAPQSEKRHGKHPTQKPVALVQRCLAASTNKGDTVLDPFAGSGTTGIAAHSLGLSSVLLEKQPEHFATAKARIAELDDLML